MQIKFILLLFCVVASPALVYAQATGDDQLTVSVTNIRGAIPARTAHIVKYYVDKPSPDSDYETGDLHIIYSDKTEVIETLSPKDKHPELTGDENQEGIDDPAVAEDQRAIAWTETYDNPATSYSIPLVLAIYQSGKSILHIRQGLMIWDWTFLNGGQHIAAVWGLTHGPEVGHYQLYDVKTGRMLSEVLGDEETQSLNPGAPEWAKQIERQMRGRK